MGKTKIVMKSLIIASLLNLIFNLILIPKFGIIGAAISTSLSYILVLLINSIYLMKFVKFKINKFVILKIIIGSILFILSLFLFKNILNLFIWIEIFIGLFLSLVFYLIFLFLSKTLTFKELKSLRN